MNKKIIFSVGHFNFSKDGKYFIKEVAKVGNHIASDGTAMELTKDILVNACKTFSGHVPVPLTHRGFYNPMMNTGWVKEVWFDNGSMFAKIEITEKDVAEKIENKTINDDSIALAFENDEWKLEHIALTLNPAIEGLGGFIPVEFEANENPVYCFEKSDNAKFEERKETTMEKIEFEKKVSEFEATIKAKDEAIAQGKIEFEKLNAEKENIKVELEKAREVVAKFEAEKIESEIDTLIKLGKLTPAQKEFSLALIKADKVAFEKFVESITPLPVAPKVVEPPVESAKKQYSKKDISAMNKEQYVAFAEEMKNGKAEIVK